MLSCIHSVAMTRTLLDSLVDYLEETLSVVISPKPWRQPRLPHFLKETYTFHETKILDVRCLLMLDEGPEEAPAALRKHIALVQPRWTHEIIYVRPQVTAYHRRRLVEQKVPFIVPGTQMYLPTLGVAFRERFKQLREAPRTLSPSAQALLIDILLRADHDALTPKEAAARLGYSAMSMTRAFNELEATKLAVSERSKERHLRLTARPHDTWTRALTFLRSPVEKRLCIQRTAATTRGPRAGLSALAETTMLAAPTRETYALSRKEWVSLRRRHEIIEVPRHDPDAQEIEVWSYSPTMIARGGLVDPLSLYLSLRDSDDERVAASLDELMETVKWPLDPTQGESLARPEPAQTRGGENRQQDPQEA